MYLQTKGLVLRETEYKDADKLLTVLTAEHGTLTLKARGVRKNASKIKGPCQLLCYSSFTASSYQGYYSITEAEVIEMFPGLRQDLEQLSLASWFAQAAETVADADAPSPELLRLTLNALYALANRVRPPRLIKAAFEFKLACLAGFLPELSACVVCGKEAPDGFDVTRGALCCLDCRDEDRGLCLPIDENTLQALRYIALADPSRLFSFTLPEASLEQLGQAAETYLMMQFQRSFSALDFYKGLFRLTGPDRT